MHALAARDAALLARLRPAPAPEMLRQRGVRIPACHNIVCLVSWDTPAPARYIAERTLHAEYDPSRFAAATLRVVRPPPRGTRLPYSKTAALAFSNSKVVCPGTHTTDGALLAVHQHRILQRRVVPGLKMRSFRIVNRVYTSDAGHALSLRLIKENPQLLGGGGVVVWDPERFSGLMLRIADPKVTVKIFCSGKVNLMGGAAHADPMSVWMRILPGLMQVPDPNRPESAAERYQYRQDEDARIGALHHH